MKCALTLLFFILSLVSLSQTIWSENFESYTNGTQNSIKWTTQANNCDADGLPGVSSGNYWGVKTNSSGDKEFCADDIEGITCCLNQQGQSDNIWISEDIDISQYTGLSISFLMRNEGDMECSSCGQGNDGFKSEYQIDGGSWITISNICGVSSGFVSSDCVEIPTGQILKIRFLLGSQANGERYFFDDIVVSQSDCYTALPVELISFTGKSEGRFNVIEWKTATEYNSSHFDLEKSEDGINWKKITQIPSVGNSNYVMSYVHSDFGVSKLINYYRLIQFDIDGELKLYSPIAIDNRDFKNIIKITNSIGQSVDDNYTGIIIIYYEDGEIFRTYK
jgi:hypothetical protein